MPKKTEKVQYMVKVEDWKVDCGFGINTLSKDDYPEDYSEHSGIILMGKLLLPVLKKTKRAKIKIMGSPELEDHWKYERKDPPTATGWIEISKGSDTVEFHSLFPHRNLSFILMAVASGKVGFASICGTKLRYRKADLLDLELLSTQGGFGDE